MSERGTVTLEEIEQFENRSLTLKYSNGTIISPANLAGPVQDPIDIDTRAGIQVRGGDLDYKTTGGPALHIPLKRDRVVSLNPDLARTLRHFAKHAHVDAGGHAFGWHGNIVKS